MISIIFAIATAAVWGTADFCGGKASQRTPALAVSVLSKLAAVPVLVAGLALTGGRPTLAGLGWGALAGLFGMAGVTLLYRGLATGAMTVVAPVTAVTSALVPFLVGTVVDGAQRPAAMIGAGCAVAAIALVSTGSGERGDDRTGDSNRTGPAVVGLALAAGLGFALFMTFVSRAGRAGATGLWPLVPAHLAALILGTVLLRRTRTAPRIRGHALTWTVFAGVLDFGANVLYLLASRGGALSVVAPISSLYPASTVLLALAIDRERVRPLQLVGLGFAATALVLVVS
jgi:drug/metabolite transporter (DMT)-like permease